MPNLMLISLMKRSNHLFQPSHDSFAEPKGKRWDVGHRSLFSYQNDFGMGCTCWRTVIGNGHRELRVLSQKSTYRKAGNVHWSYCNGVWVVDGSSSPQPVGSQTLRQGWVMLHFPVDIYCYPHEKSVSSSNSSWLDTFTWSLLGSKGFP